MPTDPNRIQQLAQDWVAQRQAERPRPEFAVPRPPQTRDEQINNMPNADKLTQTERKIYDALPGISTWMENNRIMGRTVSEQLDKFNGSWAGRALNMLDVFAEGLERSVGLVGQMDDPDFDWDNLQSAWYAGSLTYDTTNLPQIVREQRELYNPRTRRTETANVAVGLRLPTDLPGSGGVSAARAKIQAYIDQGMDPKDALAKTRDEYYNGLGALALRAQLNDTYGHVLGDPLNLLTAWLKPVQALKARRFMALTTKLTGGAEDVLTSASRAADLANTAANASDALKYADEALRLAGMAGDSKLAAQYSTRAAEIAKGLGKTDDATRYTQEAARLAGLSPEDAARFSDDALRGLGRKQLNSLDKFAIMATGGDPFRPNAVGKVFEKVPIIGKLFRLTPESKAKEVLTLVSDNIGSNVIARMMQNPNAEADFVSYMRRVSKGATGIEYGHGMMTLEGRTVQAFVKGTEADIERMFQTYTELAPTRGKLDLIAQTVGESPEKLLRLMDDTPEAVMRMLEKYAPSNPTLAAMLQAGEITPDGLRAISKSIGDLPYSREMFFAQAMDAIETAAMRQAVVQFGVKSKGVLTRWSDAIKSAESLAFLKLNPGYPIRNKLNNDMTMLARGLFGMVDEAGIDKFWNDFGVTPARLGKAELAQDISGAGKLKEADRILQEALRGGNYGTPDKVKEFFSKIDLGRADFAGYWGQKFESQASRKAYTLGAQQFLRRYFKPKSARAYISPRVMDEIANLSPDLEKQLNNAIRASGAMEGKFDELLGSNLNLNVDSILDDVTEAAGVDVRAALGDEVLERIHQGLPEAIAQGRVDEFIAAARQTINNHIDDLFNKQIENVVEHVKAQAAAGGPNVWNKTLAEAQDLFWGAHIEYSNRMPEATRLAREASNARDFAAARALWAKEAEDGRLFYSRAFRRVDAYIDGLEQGTAHLAGRGVKLPFAETKRTFRQWKAMWEEFHAGKKKLIEDFFDDPAARSFDDVQAELDSMFQKAIDQEDVFSQQLDDTIAAMIPSAEARAAYTNARDALAELRRTDKANVAALRREIADLPKEERQIRWNEFWAERATRYQEMRSVDAASIAIQQGDDAAMQMFESLPTAPKDAGTAEFNIYSMANEYGIPSATNAGKRNDRRILATVNKYAPEGSRGIIPSEGTTTTNLDDFNFKEFSEAMGKEFDVKSAWGDFKAYKSDALSPAEHFESWERAHSKFFEKKFENVSDIPEDVARSAFEARAAQKGTPVTTVTPKITPNFIADVNKVIPPAPPIDLSLDMLAYGRQYGLLDEIAAGAKRAARKTPVMVKDLPQNLQDEVMRAVGQIKNDFSATRYQAMKFGEWRRDSALLNYNRRTNFDNYLAHVAPFAFWSTSSMFQWAVESIDRPAMLTNYLRAKKFLATAGLERDGMASRTKGKIRIDLPFAPDWMGEQFIDPLRLVLPFDNWAAPFEQFQRDQEGAAGRTVRVLDQLLAEDKISQDDYDDAITERAGATWEYAEAMMSANDQSDRYDAWDFGTAMASPHAPIMWAYNAAFGDKEDIGPFSPLSRIMRNAATMMGVEDWNNSKYNLEAKIRRQMGLNAYDKWDDYRIDRSLSNLAGDGSFTPDEVKEGMAISALVQAGKMTPEEAKAQSEAYREAVKRSNQEFTGGGAAFGLGLLGISITSVPQGENNLRRLQDDFGQAYQKYKTANDSLEAFLASHREMDEEEAADEWERLNPRLAKDGDALTDFFDKHPEYETRLGLFDPPEEKLHKFMIDQVWKKFNEMPKVNQEEIREHLGAEFQDSFMNRATRSYDDIPNETMAVWLKMMGTDPLGGLTADQRMLVNLYGKVQYTDPETANRVQVFYDSRNTSFDGWYESQSEYYELPKGNQRKAYLRTHPELKQYWDFRSNFMRDNPDLVPYLTDNEEAIEKAKNQTRSSEVAIPTAQEIRVNLDPDTHELLYDYFATGEALPPVVMRELDYIGSQQGLTGDQVLGILGGGLYGQP